MNHERTTSPSNIKIFIDFDGTITCEDVGDALFETFGGKQCLEFIRLYREEKLSAIECFRRESNACGLVDKTALDAFLDSREIDSTFASFIDFCRAKGFTCTIVSDGMDYYIQRILKRHGLGHVPFLANTLDLVPADDSPNVRLVPSFPTTDEVCDRCACCKRNHMLSLTGDDDVLVYIGEGYSDRCPARYADIVFAKDELLKHCRQENIPYFEYRTFSEIRQRFEGLLAAHGTHVNRLGFRKRRRAELARREVFMSE